MLHPEGRAVFIEIGKTGSTAATTWLRNHGWFQNGSKGHGRIPGTSLGRHAFVTEETVAWLDEYGVSSYAVIRNPWDRIASLWRASAPKSMSFDQYLRNGRFKHGSIDFFRFNQLDWIAPNTRCVMYDQLVSDWNAEAETLGHLPPVPAEGFPKVNVSVKRTKPEWNEWSINWVAERFARDIERWGFTGPS